MSATRANDEEIERLERAIVKDLQNDTTCNRERLYQRHRVRSMIDRISNTMYKFIEIYEDKDSGRKDEIAALGGQTASGKEYHRLKEALAALRLKTGGTIRQRAERL